jgi:hypothetical protein
MSDKPNYPSWDERYGIPGYVYGTEPNEYLVEMTGRIPMGPVLALADGEGRNGVYLAGRRFERVEEKVREIREGRFHGGPGAVVQILAFKNGTR